MIPSPKKPRTKKKKQLEKKAANKKVLLERAERSVARAKRKAELDAAPPKKALPKGRPQMRKPAEDAVESVATGAAFPVALAAAPVEVMGDL
jgi:hypothetical protein